MSVQLIGTILQIILSIAGSVSNSTTIDNIIKTLSQFLPILLQEAEDLIPVVDQIIDLLKGNNNLTDEQIANVEALNKKSDDDFEDAASKV